jgi:hypothetical protein
MVAGRTLRAICHDTRLPATRRTLMTRGGIHHDVPKRLAERLQQDAVRTSIVGLSNDQGVTIEKDAYRIVGPMN